MAIQEKIKFLMTNRAFLRNVNDILDATIPLESDVRITSKTKMLVVGTAVEKAVEELIDNKQQLNKMKGANLTDMPDSFMVAYKDILFVVRKYVVKEYTSYMGKYFQLNPNDSDDILSSAIVLDTNDFLTFDEITKVCDVQTIFNAIMLYINHGNIDTKFVEPKHKFKVDGFNYRNKDKFNMYYIDTTWKMRINTEGFPVRGHFRLQPYKFKKAELIWIEAYQKKGYNRKAGIELANLNL